MCCAPVSEWCLQCERVDLRLRLGPVSPAAVRANVVWAGDDAGRDCVATVKPWVMHCLRAAIVTQGMGLAGAGYRLINFDQRIGRCRSVG